MKCGNWLSQAVIPVMDMIIIGVDRCFSMLESNISEVLHILDHPDVMRIRAYQRLNRYIKMWTFMLHSNFQILICINRPKKLKIK